MFTSILAKSSTLVNRAVRYNNIYSRIIYTYTLLFIVSKLFQIPNFTVIFPQRDSALHHSEVSFKLEIDISLISNLTLNSQRYILPNVFVLQGRKFAFRINKHVGE